MDSRGDGRLRYSPALDGVRALAVTAVIAFHAEVGPFSGGFLGVSVFFTLSGYLIASLLLIEHRSTGTIDLPNFYVRRARRLLPAAWLTIGVVVLATPWWSSAQRADVPGDALAALAQVYNWKVALAPDTYANIFAGEPSPLAHFWSLAIEEQFYLVAPVALAFALGRRGGRRHGVVTAWVGAMVVGCGISSWLVDDADLVYNATFTRAGELLAGVFLALVLERRSVHRHLADAAGFTGLAAITALCLTATLSSNWIYDGGLIGVAVASCALVVGAHHGAVVPRFLGVSVLASIGRVSYGLYLFHWPVFVVLTPSRTGFDGIGLLVARLAVTVALTLASYRLLETPVRRWQMAGRPFLGASAAVAIVSLLLVVTTSVGTTRPGEVLASPTGVSGMTGGVVRFDDAPPTLSTVDAPESPPTTEQRDVSRGTVPPPPTVRPEPPAVLVVGGDAAAVDALRALGSAVRVIDAVEPDCSFASASGRVRCPDVDAPVADARVIVVALSETDIVDAALHTGADGLDEVAAARQRTESGVSGAASGLASRGIPVVAWNATDDPALDASLSKLHLRDRTFADVATDGPELRSSIRELIADHATPLPDRPRVLVLGDSTSLPFATALYGDGGRLDVLWAGEHGCPTVAVVALRASSDGGPPSARSCPGVSAQTTDAMREFAPEVVLVVAGPTELTEQIYVDGGDGTSADEAGFAVAHDAEMAHLVDIVGPGIPIVVATSPPISVGAFSTEDMARPERLSGWNAQVRRWGATHAGVHVLEYGDALLELEAVSGSIRPDGSHPTVEGLGPVIADTVVPTLEQLLAAS